MITLRGAVRIWNETIGAKYYKACQDLWGFSALQEDRELDSVGKRRKAAAYLRELADALEIEQPDSAKRRKATNDDD